MADNDPLTSALARAESETLSDIDLYTRLVDDAADRHDGHALNRFRAVLNTVRTADLFGLLAGRNVLPKYGFPVDVVPLRTAHIASREAKAVSLDRDLRIAISEYAPGAGVVAAKRLWVSGGLHLLPNRALPERTYAVCRECNRLYLGVDLAACPQCQEPIRGGTMVQPLFGFVSRDPDVKPLGEERPQRLYATRVLFHELGDPTPRFSRQGSLAVVNDARGRTLPDLPHVWVREDRWRRRGRSSPSFIRSKLHWYARQRRYRPYIHVGHCRVSLPWASSWRRCFPGRGAPRRRSANSSGRPRRPGRYHLPGAPDAYFRPVRRRPGRGAGLAREAFARIREVLEAAIAVCSCTCGENSSCYGCLRSYRNQHEHEMLDRTAAGQELAQPLASTT